MSYKFAVIWCRPSFGVSSKYCSIIPAHWTHDSVWLREVRPPSRKPQIYGVWGGAKVGLNETGVSRLFQGGKFNNVNLTDRPLPHSDYKNPAGLVFCI